MKVVSVILFCSLVLFSCKRDELVEQIELRETVINPIQTYGFCNHSFTGHSLDQVKCDSLDILNFTIKLDTLENQTVYINDYHSIMFDDVEVTMWLKDPSVYIYNTYGLSNDTIIWLAYKYNGDVMARYYLKMEEENEHGIIRFNGYRRFVHSNRQDEVTIVCARDVNQINSLNLDTDLLR